MSIAVLISLNLIELLFNESPSGVEYCHYEFPSESSKETVLNPLYHENAYNNDSVLPNANPRCPQLVVPDIYFIQTAALVNVRGLNLNKCCPVHDDEVC